MQRARLAAAVAAMVLAAVATAGCSSSGDGGGGDTATKAAAPVGPHATELVKELNQIVNTEESRAWISYGDLAALRALGGGKVPAELAMMVVNGWPTTHERDADAQVLLGLDGSRADQAVEVGDEHGWGRFDGGLDTAAITAKARKDLEAEQDGTVGELTLWRLAPDDLRQVGQKPIVALSRGTADFNVLAVDADTLVRAPSRRTAELLSADGQGRTLARDLTFRAVAECLGRPLAAALTDKRIQMGGASPAPGTFTVGAGVTGGSAEELAQVACRTASSQDEAEKIADALRDELAHGKTRLSRLPWHELISDTKVTVTGGPAHVVKVTGVSQKSPQVVLEMLRSGDLGDLLDPSN